jgi:hypothetical protein
MKQTQHYKISEAMVEPLWFQDKNEHPDEIKQSIMTDVCHRRGKPRPSDYKKSLEGKYYNSE